MEKAKIEIEASNFGCRQMCYICGSRERQDGIDMRLRLPGNEESYFLCPVCQGVKFDGSRYSLASFTKIVPKWPEMLRKRAVALREWAEELEAVAEMEFVLPYEEDWNREIKQRMDWDKEIQDDQEDPVPV